VLQALSIVAFFLAGWLGVLSVHAAQLEDTNTLHSDVSPFARFSQLSYGSTPRFFAPPSVQPGSNWQAASAARKCTPGGTVLRVDRNNLGYDVRVLVADQVMVVRIDSNGNCR
jgi:hypothetical protein